MKEKRKEDRMKKKKYGDVKLKKDQELNAEQINYYSFFQIHQVPRLFSFFSSP